MTDDTGMSMVVFPNGAQNSDKAPTNGFSYSVYSDPYTGYVDVTMQAQEGNPLVAFAPPISYALNIIIDPGNNSTTITFDHTVFSSFQVFLEEPPSLITRNKEMRGTYLIFKWIHSPRKTEPINLRTQRTFSPRVFNFLKRSNFHAGVHQSESINKVINGDA